ncbi:MAG: hypothetical protein ACYTF9_00425 [Planctomycetota bacterium]|jgi:hypothetical protein
MDKCNRWIRPTVLRSWALALLLVLGAGTAPGLGQERRAQDEDRVNEILEGLERGLHAIELIGNRAAMEMLRDIANDVRARAGRQTDRASSRGHSSDGKRSHSSDSKRSHSSDSDSSRSSDSDSSRSSDSDSSRSSDRDSSRSSDRDSSRSSQRSNDRDGSRSSDRARGSDRSRSGERSRDRGGDVDRRGQRARRADLQRLETMEVALQGLREAGRPDAASAMERAIDARRASLDGNRGEPRRAPGIDDQVELLNMAARLLNQGGQERKAKRVGDLAQEMAQRRGMSDREARIEQLRRSIKEIEAEIERLSRGSDR